MEETQLDRIEKMLKDIHNKIIEIPKDKNKPKGWEKHLP